MKVPLSIPSINQSDKENVLEVLESGHLVQGSHVRLLEKVFANIIGVKHAVAVSSGTATLHLALLSLGIGPGDEVIVPAFSHVATANVVILAGAKPVFVDIDPVTFNIGPAGIESAITERTKAIMPVHEFGYPADRELIQVIADENKLSVIEDAACALGSSWENAKVGTWGRAASFSLHPRKIVTSGEGGVLTTDEPTLAAYYRTMRNQGMNDEDSSKQFVEAGFNYRMTDIQASLAIGQLERLESIISRRIAIANRYENELEALFFQKPASPQHGRTNWQTYHIVLNYNVDQYAFLAFLREKEINANYGAQCIPVQSFYRNKYGYGNNDYPQAFKAFSKGIALPLYDTMTEEQQSYVIESVNSYRSA